MANFERKKKKALAKNGIEAETTKQPAHNDNQLEPTDTELTNQLHVDLLGVIKTRFEKGGGALSLEQIHDAYEKYVTEAGRTQYQPLGKAFAMGIDAITTPRSELKVLNGKLVGWVLKGQSS